MPALLPGIEDAMMNSVKVPALGADTGEGGENTIINEHTSEISSGIHSMPGTLVMEERASKSLRVSSPGSVSEQQSLDLRSYYLCSFLYLHCLFLVPDIKYLMVRPQFPKLCPALLLEER